MKTIAYNRPSYVKAEIGSWFSFPEEGNAKGEMEVTVTKGNGGSYVHLNFDFTKEYALGFVAAVLGVFSFCVIGVALPLVIMALSSSKPFDPTSTASILLIGWSLGVIATATVMTLEGRTVSQTEKRLIEEFNLFTLLLSTKKD